MKPHLGRYDKAGIGADGKKDKQALQMGPIDLIIQSITDRSRRREKRMGLF